MKATINIILYSIFSLVANAQATFELTVSDPLDQVPTSVIETDEYYIFSTIFGMYSTIGVKTQLLKMDKQGNIVLSVIPKPETYQFSINIVVSGENGRVIGIGYQKAHIDSVAYFTIVEMDESFTILTEKTYRTCFNNLVYLNVEKVEDCYVILGSGQNMENYHYRLFAYKINSSFDTLISKIYPGEGIKVAFDILPTLDGNNFKVFCRGYNQQTNTFGQIVFLDSMLEWVDIKGIPESVLSYNDAMYIDETHYLLTGKKTLYNSNPQDDQIAIMLMDTADMIQDIQLLGAADTIDYPGFYSNLDFIDANDIYFSGVKNLPLVGPFSPVDSWFFLNKLNSSLEVQWQKFYGGNAFYWVWLTIATQDGGCLMAGTRYDYITQTNLRDVYILKVDEDGLVTGFGDGPPQIIAHDAIVYPNPGSSYLKIQSGPQINGAVFEMFDMTGKAVAREILNGRLVEINTGPLPTGTYTYRISWQNRLVGSGKWVKM